MRGSLSTWNETMAWYDLFSSFYDEALERHYMQQRLLAAAAMRIEPGMALLDVPCGTGQSLVPLLKHLGPNGPIVGVDLSQGMVNLARRRAHKLDLFNVSVVHASAATVTPAELGRASFDRIHVFLGMTVFDDHEAVTEHLWSLLAPGGLMAVIDVYNPKPGFQGRAVQWMAQADITRRWWEPLEMLAARFERTELPSAAVHGGAIWMAVGEKAGG